MTRAPSLPAGAIAVTRPQRPDPEAQGAFRWDGRLRDAGQEQGFKSEIWPEWSGRIRMVALLATGLFMLFTYTDYLTLGFTPMLAVCAGARLLVLVAALWAAYLVRQNRGIQYVEASTLALMLLLPTVIFLIISIHQRGISFELPGVILMTLCYYLFVPLPLAAVTFASVYGTVGFLLLAALRLEPSPTALALSGFELLLCNVLGIYIARRAHVMQRRQWLGLCELRRRAAFEDLIARQSTRFISIPVADIEDGIQIALAEIAEFAGADRGYVFQYDTEGAFSRCTHEWCRPGVDGGLIRMQRAPMGDFPWSARQMLGGRIICVRSLEDLPPEAGQERVACGALSVRSMLVVPLFFEDRLCGAVGFHTVHHEIDWDRELVSLLRMVGEMIVGAWNRRRVGLELRERNRALEASVAALEKSNSELQQFAYVASHDMKEPLRVISSFSGLLANRYRGKLDDRADEYIGYLTGAAGRMYRMITDLLEFSRVDHQVRPFTAFDSGAVLQQALDNLRVSIRELKARIEVGPMPTVEADPGQVLQLFQNLIGNALKFHNGRAPTVSISAEPVADRWQFSIADNGIGVEHQDAERIFQAFTRLHHSDQYPGTGIGLAVCKRIVERHRGRIWVQPNHPTGSVFRFTLDAA